MNLAEERFLVMLRCPFEEGKEIWQEKLEA
jgi:hypothetical protein